MFDDPYPTGLLLLIFSSVLLGVAVLVHTSIHVCEKILLYVKTIPSGRSQLKLPCPMGTPIGKLMHPKLTGLQYNFSFNLVSFNFFNPSVPWFQNNR